VGQSVPGFQDRAVVAERATQSSGAERIGAQQRGPAPRLLVEARARSHFRTGGLDVIPQVLEWRAVPGLEVARLRLAAGALEADVVDPVPRRRQKAKVLRRAATHAPWVAGDRFVSLVNPDTAQVGTYLS